MSPEEKTRIVIFLSLIAIIYIFAANAVLRIALPFYGALMTLSKFGKRFEGGT